MDRITKKIGKTLFILGMLIFASEVFATHIRAGEITAVRINQFELTYRFTITGFRDSGSPIEFGAGVLKLGDGTEVSGPFNVTRTNVGNEIELVTFSYVHTYTAPNGNGYLISYQEDFRNANIINMDNSVNTTFYVETQIVIDSFLGLNDTPILTVPPIDFAAVGALFIHNPGAFDPDGDSLAYRLITPKKGSTQPVNNYRELNSADFYSNFSIGSEAGNPPTLSINAITGDLIWDAPGDAFLSVAGNSEQREYNVAFVVEEWRNVSGTWYQMGYVVRDMQIIVTETDNERPVIDVPDDLCVEAGDQVMESIFATDSDGDPIRLEAFGGPFEVDNNATFTPSGNDFQSQSPARLQLEWSTNCSNVRERPYEIQFKATDDPSLGVRLVEFETLQITVVGPAPTGLEVSVQQGRSMQLSWDEYSCTEANLMQVWRKIGAFDIDLDECQVGMPNNTGYEMIDLIPIAETTYLDTNNGKGLSPGAKYCYRLVAEFPLPGGGLSYISEEDCDSLEINVPVITNVDIKTTSTTNGEILIKWIPPYQIDELLFPPDYTYDLFRSSNQAGSDFGDPILSKTSDTTFVDSGLNTKDFQYNYFVRFYDGNDFLVDSSATASSVRLNLRPLFQAIELNWEGNVPWSLRSPENRFHYIYRDRINDDDLSELVLIDSVNVSNGPLRFLDIGEIDNKPLFDSLEYCYFVTTQGTYDNALIPSPLLNSSQISCAKPNDTIPPCSPPRLAIDSNFECEVFLAGKPCDSQDFENKIVWDLFTEPECNDEILFYNIYFSENGDEDSFELINYSEINEFIHDNLDSFKGCYKVSAVDRSGNESELTGIVCNDNCPNITFPNVFTPNGDNINDVFTPKFSGRDINVTDFDLRNCPRFVLDLDFKVVDRSGNQVFEYSTKNNNENDILIRWDGKNQQGIELESGVYFYSVIVTFDVLDPSKVKQRFNGTIQLIK